MVARLDSIFRIRENHGRGCCQIFNWSQYAINFLKWQVWAFSNKFSRFYLANLAWTRTLILAKITSDWWDVMSHFRELSDSCLARVHPSYVIQYNEVTETKEPHAALNVKFVPLFLKALYLNSYQLHTIIQTPSIRRRKSHKSRQVLLTWIPNRPNHTGEKKGRTRYST